MDASSTYQDSLPVSSDALLEQLRGWGLEFTFHEHVPLRTVEDAKSVEAGLVVEGETAFRVKNLYLRDKKKRNYLVTLEQDREIDLKALGAQLGVGNLSFGSADRLMENLGIRPGAVSPLAMVSGAEKGVTFFMDAAAKTADRIYMHPLVNDRTIGMTFADLAVFFEKVDVSPTWLDLD
ncbi:prolyl-tRNA synthetase associated domain-containing protein [Shimia sp. CNT1-13L.2]|uniref:prolyl-tRNA synthetase associated domain-containing protein n=1 Tax=Shimia sp. CNT1-13L.2 TaxID=2959663 RepID=UPI0020CC241F|nr:prolyl-tRNA synthetase associated domain-containing protein [Shimia sp. CNT1-13L.2]MCP9482900.1 prolyl-tRNA synthetase associated domain-containing protein [Shimia sp. CNT1-13L.2]